MLTTVFGILAVIALIFAVVHAAGRCGPCLAIAVILLAIIELLRVVPLGR